MICIRHKPLTSVSCHKKDVVIDEAGPFTRPCCTAIEEMQVRLLYACKSVARTAAASDNYMKHTIGRLPQISSRIPSACQQHSTNTAKLHSHIIINTQIRRRKCRLAEERRTAAGLV
jgi:hypothetical protein